MLQLLLQVSFYSLLRILNSVFVPGYNTFLTVVSHCGMLSCAHLSFERVNDNSGNPQKYRRHKVYKLASLT